MKKIILSVVMLVQAACCMEQGNKIIAYYDNLRNCAGIVRQTSFANAILPPEGAIFNGSERAILATQVHSICEEIIKNTHVLGVPFSWGAAFSFNTPNPSQIKQLQVMWLRYVRNNDAYVRSVGGLLASIYCDDFATGVRGARADINYLQANSFAETCNKNTVAAYDNYIALIKRQLPRIRKVPTSTWKPIFDTVFCLACDAALQEKDLFPMKNWLFDDIIDAVYFF